MLEHGALSVKLLPSMKQAPTDRTLRRWHRQYRAGGLAALGDGRSLQRKDGDGEDDAFFALVEKHYLTLEQPDLTVAYRNARHEASVAGIIIRSLHQSRRHIAKLPKAVVTLRRKGAKAFNDQHAMYIERDYTTIASNDWWNADHHRLDFMVTDGDSKPFRPWLTCIQDVRSRKIVGYRISGGGNTATILDAMRMAIDGHGTPGKLYFDLGRDFNSRALGGIARKQLFLGKRREANECVGSTCGMLGITVTNCQPYHGQAKPIERWFRTLNQFSKAQPTYCGNSPENKPENLMDRIKRGASPLLVDVMDSFALFVDWYNEAHEHSGQGMDGKTPARVFDECLKERRMPDAKTMELAFWRPFMVKIGRNGVQCNRMSYRLSDNRIWMDNQGKPVVVRVNPNDQSQAVVNDEHGRFLCDAVQKELVGWNADEKTVAESIAANKAASKLAKQFYQMPRGLQMARSVPETIQHLAVEKNRKRRLAESKPAPVIRITTPMSDQRDAPLRLPNSNNGNAELSLLQQMMREGPPENLEDSPRSGSLLLDLFGDSEPDRLPTTTMRDYLKISETAKAIDAERERELSPTIQDPFQRAMEIFGKVDESEAQP
jgi:transposase InsO family protein